MKLAKKLKKTMGLMLISTMVLSAAPTMAADYDNHWAKEAITKWSDYDVVAGYEDGSFKPNNQVKRSELAAFIVRVFGLESTEGATRFADVADSAWYASDIAKVSAAGIMQGASGKFNPSGYATREEVAVTLVNAFQLTGTGELNFKDEAQIAAWAKEAVAALASNGYAKGQADNKFAPKANITRAEVVQLLDNIVEQLVHKAGTYTQDVAGNVVVNTKDAVLDSIKVAGNVYLAQGIGLGDATLSNTEVAGQVLVAGGGVNSIHFNKAVVKGGVKVDTKAPVRLVSKDSALSVTVAANQNLVLTGSFKEVVVPADVVLELKGATVEKITVVASGSASAQITIDKTSIVKELVAQAATVIKGEGKIELLKVQANGVKTEIKPGKIETLPGFNAPTYTGGTTSGGGGGGSTSAGGSGSTEDTVLKYIAIDSVALNGVPVPSSALQINGKNITLDLNGVKNLSDTVEEIETVEVAFKNLEENQKIKTVLDFSILGKKDLTDTVEAGGKVTYQVADLSAKFNAKKEELVEKLSKIDGLDQKIEDILQEVGLSLENVYLEDGSIDTDKAIEKMQEVLAYVEDNKANQELVDLVNVAKALLQNHNIAISPDYVSVTGNITVTAGDLSTVYKITIKR